ncbi:MAG: ROK family protein [Geodermatophilaceae bacterium]|nr:ROK family protein [Geodermatophilaceae bacterium]
MTARDVDELIPGADAPGSTSSLRLANQRRVIDALRDPAAGGRVTQAGIARSTKLAPATVSSIVRELAEAGLVETSGGSGRRGSEVRIARRAGLLAAVDFGHTHLRVAVGDLAGSVLAERRLPLRPDHTHADGLDLAGRTVEDLVRSLGAGREDIAGMGMGLPAPIDAAGLVVSSSILPGWVGVDAAGAAAEAMGCPVHVDNDANLCALAEHRLGAGVGHSCMAYLKASSGLGAGLIVAGQPFRGGAGTAGEIGHLTYDENGPICRCGSRGCLEAYTSTDMLRELVGQQHPEARIADLVTAAAQGDVAVQRAFEDVGHRVGWGVAAIANLINPTCLVIGGDLAQAGEMLLEPVRAGLRRHALVSVSASMHVTTSRLGERSAVVGALLLALEHSDLTLSEVG